MATLTPKQVTDLMAKLAKSAIHVNNLTGNPTLAMQLCCRAIARNTQSQVPDVLLDSILDHGGVINIESSDESDVHESTPKRQRRNTTKPLSEKTTARDKGAKVDTKNGARVAESDKDEVSDEEVEQDEEDEPESESDTDSEEESNSGSRARKYEDNPFVITSAQVDRKKKTTNLNTPSTERTLRPSSIRRSSRTPAGTGNNVQLGTDKHGTPRLSLAELVSMNGSGKKRKKDEAGRD